MSSWEDIANEVAPLGYKPGVLATGAMRGAAIEEAAERNARRPAPSYSWPVAPQIVSPPPVPFSATLDEALRGQESENVAGVFYRIARRAPEFDPVFESLCENLIEPSDYISRRTRVRCCMQDLLFLDIETTGLSSGSPLFLIGIMREQDGHALVELFLARGYIEEKAVLREVHEIVDGKTLITFNGKSFDWPYIEGRSLRYRMPVPKPRAHFDLLHHARRRWRPLVPNCRLQTLEHFLCNRKREGDIPSSRIPEQYREFAERFNATGRGAYLLAPIIHHNAWDVLTMADLVQRIDEKPRHEAFA
jgi:uncharacterized protein YprB with RNaseH-like and TPR domain